MVKSKITIKESITLLVGLAAIWGVIPMELKEQVLETVVITSPVMGIIFRQWFSSSTIVWDE